jgi:uncharacterized membrane protein
MLTVALLPFPLLQFSAWTGDGVTTAVILLFFALLLALTLEPEWPKRKGIPLKMSFFCLTVVCLSLIKISYLPVMLLVGILPILNRRYRGRALLPVILSCLLAILLFVGWYAQISGINQFYFSDAQPDPSAQASAVLGNPFRFLMRMAKTVFVVDAPIDYLRQETLIGGFYSERQPLPLHFALASAVALTLSALRTNGLAFPSQPGRGALLSAKVLCATSIALTVVLIFTAIYLNCDAVGSSYISNIAGRYFIPLLPLATIIPFALRGGSEHDTLAKTSFFNIYTIWIIVIIVSSLVAMICALLVPYNLFYP